VTEPDDILVRRCQSGDRDAFGLLVRRYAGRAVGGATVLLGNRDDALDASQEAFIRAWRNIRRFNGRSRFYTWYAALMRNVCLSRLRRRRRRGTMAELAAEPPARADQWDPAVLAERNEQIDRLWRAIGALPLHHREVIDLSHFQHLSYRQIAEALDVPLGTVMSRLHNARKALRDTLGRAETEVRR